jgi:Trk K+ transport system NAD-binding subunit
VGVFLKKSDAILLVGASKAVRLIALFLKEKGKRVILIDSNKNFIQEALNLQLEAFKVDVYDDELTNNIELNDVGYLIALTGSDQVNMHTLNKYSEDFGEQGAYKMASSKEITEASSRERESFFTPYDDYINLSEAYRENPTINEVNIVDQKEYKSLLEKLSKEEKSIPLFIENKQGIYLLPEFEKNNHAKENIKLFYLGKVLN